MHNRKPIFENLFLAVSSLAALFVLTEIIMQSFGKTICFSEGCKMTAQYTRFGDMSILLIGLTAFLSLAVLSFLTRYYYSESVAGRFLNLVLVVALTAEGFFMGYLAFRIQTVCVFCLIVFGCMVTLGILRILAGQWEVIAGFATLAVVFSLLYLVLPAGVPVTLPAERLILFYSKDCKHCSDVIAELEQRQIAAARLQVNGYAGFLKNMGIENIPTLLVNDPFQKIFLTGKDSIIRFLGTCTPDGRPARNVPQKAKSRTKAPTPTVQGSTTIDIFSQPGLLTTPSPTTSAEGMCREDAICK
jgi:uncharacterized membrane protein